MFYKHITFIYFHVLILNKTSKVINLSKKIHFNSFDLPVVDKSVLPHMVYNLNGNEYYVKTKKAETSDKVKGRGIINYNNIEWLIKNLWTLLLPSDCSYYLKNNYANNYQTITILPNDFNDIDDSKLTITANMFDGCSNLTTIPNINTSNVTNMSEMFNGCSSLTSIPTTITTANATNTTNMFNGCTNLTNITELDTSKATTMNRMFANCTKLPATFPWQIKCNSLTSVPTNLFANSSVTTVTLRNVPTNLKASCTTANLGSQLTNIIFRPLILPADCTMYLHKNYKSTYQTMTVLPDELQDADASNVTNMSDMFFICSNLKTIPLLDTSKVTNMSGMFSGCTKLTTIPQLDTSKVITI